MGDVVWGARTDIMAVRSCEQSIGFNGFAVALIMLITTVDSASLVNEVFCDNADKRTKLPNYARINLSNQESFLTQLTIPSFLSAAETVPSSFFEIFRGQSREGRRKDKVPASRPSSSTRVINSSSVVRLNARRVRCTVGIVFSFGSPPYELGRRLTINRVKSTSLRIASARTFRGSGLAACLNGIKNAKFVFLGSK